MQNRTYNRERIERICIRNKMRALSPPRMLKVLDLLDRINGDPINYPDLWTLVRLVHRGLLD